MLSANKGWVLNKVLSSTIFWVFGMTRPGIEPRSPGPLTNTLLIRPKQQQKQKKQKKIKQNKATKQNEKENNPSKSKGQRP